MQTYRPPEKSFLEKLFQNGTVIFFVGMILLLSGTFFYFKSTKIKNEIVDISKKTIFIATQKSSDSGSTQQASDSFPNDNADSDKAVTQNISNETASKSLEEMGGSGSSATSQNTLDRTAVKTDPTSTNGTTQKGQSLLSLNLVIQYAEVSQKGFYSIEDEARSSGQYISSDYSQGVINLGQQKIKALKNEVTIYSTDKKIIRENKVETWFQGLKSSNDSNNIGLTTEFKTKEISNDRVVADLKISKRYQVNLSEANSKNFQTIDYLGSLELSEDQVYFITNVLTTQPMIGQQEYLTSISPFEILKSINFKTGDTISVFFYHFEK
jgi:hypothetical protein